MAAERWYGGLGEVYTQNPGFPIPSGTGYGFIGYGNAEVVFDTLAEWRAYLNQQEADRQAAVVVKQAADAALRAQLGELFSKAAEHPHAIEFLVITESGSQAFFGNRRSAKEWAGTQAEAYALCEIRSVQLVELSEEELAARVAAL